MKIENLIQNLRNNILNNGQIHFENRVKRLKDLRNAIKINELKINEALKKDLGKSSFESYATEVGFILEEINYTLKNISSWAGVKKVRTPLTMFPGKSSIHPEPFGAVLIISPWNYPFQLCLSPFIGAWAAGNRVVIKPSEYASNTGFIIKSLIEEVFEQTEAIVIDGGLNETQELLKLKFDYIFFTGSTQVGKIIMREAAEHLTPVTLELGGKSPCLIEESANLEIAARRCAWGKFLNAGQTCVAPDYVLVPRKLQDSFIALLKKHLTSFFGDNPQTSEDYARIINEKHFDRLSSLIDEKKVVFGGVGRKEDCYLAPTILKDVAWEDKIMEDEIFGPILPLIPYDTINEAIEKILHLPKPLAFYIFSENTRKSREIIRRVPFGGGCINDTVIHLANPNLPFGGIGTSGIGSYHGKRSFDTFSHQKAIYEQGTTVDIPLRYPPYQGKLDWLKLILR